MNHVFPFGLVLLAVTVASWRAEQQPQDERALNAAVLAGRNAEVQPYLLRQSIDGRSTVGAVYTPFVRVARYIWNAPQHGTDISIDDVPGAVKDPVLHVVMLDRVPNHTDDKPTLMAAVNRPPSSAPPGTAAYFMPFGDRMPPPLSMTTVESLEALVGKLAVAGASLVGTFPGAVANQKVLEFCVYQRHDDGSYHLVSGYVTGPIR